MDNRLTPYFIADDLQDDPLDKIHEDDIIYLENILKRHAKFDEYLERSECRVEPMDGVKS